MREPTAAAMRYGSIVHPDAPGLATLVGTVVDDVTGLPELIAACEFTHQMLGKSVIVSDAMMEAYQILTDALRIAREGR